MHDIDSPLIRRAWRPDVVIVRIAWPSYIGFLQVPGEEVEGSMERKCTAGVQVVLHFQSMDLKAPQIEDRLPGTHFCCFCTVVEEHRHLHPRDAEMRARDAEMPREKVQRNS